LHYNELLDRTRAQTTFAFSERQAEEPQLSEPIPDLTAAVAGGQVPLAAVEVIVIREESRHTVFEELLIGAVLEVHRGQPLQAQHLFGEDVALDFVGSADDADMADPVVIGRKSQRPIRLIGMFPRHTTQELSVI